MYNMESPYTIYLRELNKIFICTPTFDNKMEYSNYWKQQTEYSYELQNGEENGYGLDTIWIL